MEVNFNPRTREGCDVFFTSVSSNIAKISIHAPARGATRIKYQKIPFTNNFNPRTREGCDDMAWLQSYPSLYFNPRTREGCDLRRLPLCPRAVLISIHAPARGATLSKNLQSRQGCYFNPRTREGCDVTSAGEYARNVDFNPRTREGCDAACSLRRSVDVAFQSTHPRGVRLDLLFTIILVIWYFNPRTREGCDVFFTSVSSNIAKISIHAPARGATRIKYQKIPFTNNFNPRTREGCDDMAWLQSYPSLYFNPRTREGCDLRRLPLCPRAVLISIHAPARGATLSKNLQSRQGCYFNPRTREGCDPLHCTWLQNHRDFNPRTREGCD